MTTLRTVSFIVVVTFVVGAAAAFAQPRATLVETIRAFALRHVVDEPAR